MRGPTVLWLVRHGQSVGNVAAEEAEARGAEVIDVVARGADVPLSSVGERQARALGTWMRSGPPPTRAFCSPFERAHATARLLLAGARATDVRLVTDERLREKELGALDRLTRAGIRARFPEEVERRRELGRLYYRPPNGESWADVMLRLRSFLDSLALSCPGERVLVVAHSVTMLCARYVIDELGERQLLAVDEAAPIANCALTTWVAGPGGELVLDSFNVTAPLEEGGAEVTDAEEPTKSV